MVSILASRALSSSVLICVAALVVNSVGPCRAANGEVTQVRPNIVLILANDK